MNNQQQQRSRSKQRQSPASTVNYQQSYSSSIGYGGNSYQRPPSTDRINQQRSSNLKEYSQNSLYPNYQSQFRRSPSPINTNKLLKQSSKPSSNISINLPQYQSSLININNQSPLININNQSPLINSQLISSQYQKLYLKDVANIKKIQRLQQVQLILRQVKKPFQPSDIPTFQSLVEKLSVKYKFQQVYTMFVYFFIHYSLLDENIYRMYYAIIVKGVNQFEERGNNNGLLVSFYDVLIKCTIKVTFQQFITLFKQNTNKHINQQNYFMISQQLRQSIINQSLYPSTNATSSSVYQSSTNTPSVSQIGSSIRNTLTLIRKSMQRQKAPNANERSPDFIHPIRQILKLIKTTIKSLLQTIFIHSQQQSTQSYENTQSTNTFYLILFSQLSMIIHSKYKHHLTAEYQQTLNEITILKMKLSQLNQQLSKIINTNEKTFNANEKIMNINEKNTRNDGLQQKELLLTFERLKKQHDGNYLYLLFVVNLSTYNRNQSIGQSLDVTIHSFFLQPLLQEYRKSSQFLYEKIGQNMDKVEKLRFFLSTIKNYGMYQQTKGIKVNQRLYQFVNFSYSNLLLRSLDYLCENNDLNDKIKGEKLISILNSLCYYKTSFNEINQNKSIKEKISNLKKPRLNATQVQQQQQNKNNMQIQQQHNKEQQTHLQDQFAYLIDKLIKKQLQIIQKTKKNIIKQIIQKTNTNKDDDKVLRENNNRLPQVKQVGYQNKLKQNSQKSKQHIKRQTLLLKSIKRSTLLLKSIKNQFTNRQNYHKLLIYLYLIHKNNKYQQTKKFIDEYMTASQIENRKRSQQIIDEDDEVIESFSYDQKLLMRLNRIVQLQINKIQQVHMNQKQLIQLLLQDVIIQKNFMKIYNSTQCIQLYGRAQIIQLYGRAQIIQLYGRAQCIQLYNSTQCIKLILEGLHYNNQQVVKSIPSESKNKILSVVTFMLYQQQYQIKHILIQSQQQATSLSINKARLTNENRPSNFVRQLNLQINTLDKVIRNYITIKQSPIKSTQINLIQKMIYQKKIQVLFYDINYQLQSILNKIINQSSNHKTLYTQNNMINLQIVIQTLLFILFNIQGESSNILNHQLKTNNINDGNTNKNKNDKRKQTQLQIRNKLITTINLTLSSNKQQSYNTSSQTTIHYTSKQYIISHILQTIYTKFSSYDQSNSLTTTINSISTLEDMLILKLKKCMSLYYDKINQWMINQFLLNKKLFILRCLAITFYKIKPLSELILNKYSVFPNYKYSVFPNQYSANLSTSMSSPSTSQSSLSASTSSTQNVQFVKNIFFFIPNQKALQSYLKCIAYKDKFFIKSQLIKYRTITNGKADKLIQILDQMT